MDSADFSGARLPFDGDSQALLFVGPRNFINELLLDHDGFILLSAFHGKCILLEMSDINHIDSLKYKCNEYINKRS